MWTRKELKDKAKVSFKANYWKSVFVALIVLALAGGMGMLSSMPRGSFFAAPSAVTHSSSDAPNDVNVEVKDGKVHVDVDDEDGKVHVDLDGEDAEQLSDVLEDLHDEGVFGRYGAILAPTAVLFGLSLMLLMLVVAAFAIALYVFILSPLEVGAARFFVRNLNQRAEVKEITFGYDNNYKEVVKTIFLRSLFVFLWSLLLIIPGIYKAYEYRMIPYLMGEDPTMTKDRAFAESKRMMDGQKWNAFVLDLSFLGWSILSALTMGILGVFYVGPYQTQTNAALYEKLRYGLPAPQPVQQVPVAAAPATNVQPNGAQVIVPTSQPPVPPFAAAAPAPTDMTAPAPYDASAAAPAPTGLTAPTAPLPDADAAAQPPAGGEPTAPQPGDAENGSAADSPEA